MDHEESSALALLGGGGAGTCPGVRPRIRTDSGTGSRPGRGALGGRLRSSNARGGGGPAG